MNHFLSAMKTGKYIRNHKNKQTFVPNDLIVHIQNETDACTVFNHLINVRISLKAITYI